VAGHSAGEQARGVRPHHMSERRNGDAYSVLGVLPDADDTAIATAYRALARGAPFRDEIDTLLRGMGARRTSARDETVAPWRRGYGYR
jgi:hypothetical protein